MNPHAIRLLEQARHQLSAGDRTGASVSLGAALELAPAFLEAHNLREEYRLPGNFADWTGVNAVISPEDDIFRFFATHPHSRNPLRDYLADGWRTLSDLQRVFDSFDRSVFRCSSFLEFAAGHGRFTRHLVQALPGDALTVSDVVPGSVAFLRQHWGVKGFYSTSSPQLIEIPATYQVVFALSLFTHLPETSWCAWLERLYGAVASGGALIITTHGEQAAGATGIELAPKGFCFFPASESRVLDCVQYGTSYASREFVEDMIATSAAGARVGHMRAAFWNHQDAWVLRRE